VKHPRTYRYRLYPTRGQIEALEGQLAFNCDLYNAALEQRIWAYRTWGVTVGRKEQQHDLTGLRKGGLEMNYVCQEMVLQRLQLAFDAFFRRVRQGETPGFPRFKAKHRFNTLSWRNAKGGARVVDGRLRIQGVGSIKVKWHRELPSDPKQTRITRRNDKWYVAFAVEVEAHPLAKSKRQIGVDRGVSRLASLSNGRHLKGPRARQANARKVARVQRHVGRCQLGSRRRRKAVHRLARLKEREGNRRLDRAHKIARELVDRYDLIAIEDLRTRNMVRGNRGLNREINDQGWAMLAHCLAYKAESAGRELVLVDPRNTSRTCAECGTVDARSRKGLHFTCVDCGYEADADTNAAQNILARALAGTQPSGANAQVASVVREASSGSSRLREVEKHPSTARPGRRGRAA
jgi:putative transposase